MDTVTILDGLVAGAYILMAFELLFLPVPSEASTFQLLRVDRCHSGGGHTLAETRSLPMAQKFLHLAAPCVIGVVGMLLPLAHLAFPAADWILVLGDGPALPWLAAILIVGGSGFTFASVLQIRAQSKCNSRGKRPRALATRGLYAVSRNPGLIGNYALYLGLILYLPAPVLAICFAVYVWNMHKRIMLEESHLECVFNRHFRQYKSEVPRYLRFPTANCVTRIRSLSAHTKGGDE